jgi:processive 1,2-diacylglycerol beta-glucosyltransferase
LIDPLRGQEEWNADYVVRVGAGVQVRIIDMVSGIVQNVLADTERLELMQARARAAGSSDAAFAIADILLSGPSQAEQTNVG